MQTFPSIRAGIRKIRRWWRIVVMGGLTAACGCGLSTNTTQTDTGNDTEVLSYQGKLSGSVSNARTTRDSLDDSAAQTVPADIDPESAEVHFEDLGGNPLVDAAGEPYPPVPLDASGNFEADGLPVGVDFVVSADLDGDNAPDVSHVVQIPADETGRAGRLDNVVVDPLTTLIVAQLREFLVEAGVNPDELGVSPTAIVQKVVDSFIHLFEETGLEKTVTLDDIKNTPQENLTDLFDEFVPDVARTGLETAEATLSLERAKELPAMVQAAAEVFLRAGFPIEDAPGGFDLSFLGQLDNVTTRSFEELKPPDDLLMDVLPPDLPPPTQEEIDALLAQTSLDPTTIDQLVADGTVDALFSSGVLDSYLMDGQTYADLDPALIESLLLDPTVTETAFQTLDRPVIYVSTVTEPDRNFALNESFDPEAEGHPLPILTEHLLQRMAKLQLEGRTITLRNLARLLTDVQIGLGVRLTYFPPVGPFGGGMIFESADGTGRMIDPRPLFEEFKATGIFDFETDVTAVEDQLGTLRSRLADLLADTKVPTLEQLFGPILTERITSAEQLFSLIRKAQAHLPFNPSGPSSFFVVADGDPFNPDGLPVHAVTVDVTFDDRGFPSRITYNPNQTGEFYLSFTGFGEGDKTVELLVRETGRFLFGPKGEPVILNLADNTLFEPINGMPFLDFVSESGSFYPGVSVAVPNPDFRLEESTDPTAEGPTRQLFVLATAPGPDAEPVRVDYDPATGTFSASPEGRYYMMFVPETETQDLFGLYDIQLNFMVGVNDLNADRFVEIQPIDATMDPTGTDPTADPNLNTTTDPNADPNMTTTDPNADPNTTGDPNGGSNTTDMGGGNFKGRMGHLVSAQTTPDSGTTTDPTVDPTTDPTLDPTAPPPTEPPAFEPVLLSVSEVAGLDVARDFFEFVYGIEVPNENFNPDANPYFDDANGNGVQDPGELTVDFLPVLHNPGDWRSTDVSRYYRRADGGAVTFDEIDFNSPDPRATDGTTLVPRNFLARRNAFRFGRPSTAINLLTAFLPPDFFDGTKSLNEETRVDILQALAMINLVMEQIFNVEVTMDIDGPGPMEPRRMLIDAHPFVFPLGDPLLMVIDGFETLSEPAAP